VLEGQPVPLALVPAGHARQCDRAVSGASGRLSRPASEIRTPRCRALSMAIVGLCQMTFFRRRFV